MFNVTYIICTSVYIKLTLTLNMSIFQSLITPLLRSISNRPLSGSSFSVKTVKFCRIKARQLKSGRTHTSGGTSAGTASVSVFFILALLLLLLLLPLAWTSGDSRSTITSICSTEIRTAQNFTKSLKGRRLRPSRTDDTWAHLPVSCCKRTNSQQTINMHKLLANNALKSKLMFWPQQNFKTATSSLFI